MAAEAQVQSLTLELPYDSVCSQKESDFEIELILNYFFFPPQKVVFKLFILKALERVAVTLVYHGADTEALLFRSDLFFFFFLHSSIVSLCATEITNDF